MKLGPVPCEDSVTTGVFLYHWQIDGRFCSLRPAPSPALSVTALSQSFVGESRLHAVRSVSEPSLQGAGFFYVELKSNDCPTHPRLPHKQERELLPSIIR